MATPNTIAKVFKNANANTAPHKIGKARCREAKVMHTNWLLSPISAAAINAKLVPAVAEVLAILPEAKASINAWNKCCK
jgi:hypothetical protein